MTTLIDFADDLAGVVVAKHHQDVELYASIVATLKKEEKSKKSGAKILMTQKRKICDFLR